MSNAIWPRIFKCFQRFLNTISFLLNQPTANQKSASIESIMAMYTDLCLIHSLRLGGSKTFLDDSNETLYIFLRRRDLGSGGVFVICNRGAVEGRRIISSIDAVRDIYDMAYFWIQTNQMEWRVNLVCLAENLRIRLIKADGYFHRSKGRCPDEI